MEKMTSPLKEQSTNALPSDSKKPSKGIKVTKQVQETPSTDKNWNSDDIFDHLHEHHPHFPFRMAQYLDIQSLMRFGATCFDNRYVTGVEVHRRVRCIRRILQQKQDLPTTDDEYNQASKLRNELFNWINDKNCKAHQNPYLKDLRPGFYLLPRILYVNQIDLTPDQHTLDDNVKVHYLQSLSALVDTAQHWPEELHAAVTETLDLYFAYPYLLEHIRGDLRDVLLDEKPLLTVESSKYILEVLEEGLTVYFRLKELEIIDECDAE